MTTEKIVVIDAMTMWCDPHRINQMSGKVQCDLVRLDDVTVKRLREAGLTVNFDTKNDANAEEFKGFWIRPKADQAVPVKDMGKPAKDLPPTLFIGNGSIVKCAVEPKEWFHKDSGKSGVKAKWLGMRVKEFVAYDPDATAKAKADSMLDAVSGGEEGGYSFGESLTGDTTSAEENVDQTEVDALFDE